MQRASSSLRRSLGALRLRFNGNIAVQDCSKWISSRKLITGCRCINSATKVSDFTSGRGIYSRVVQDEAAKTAKLLDLKDSKQAVYGTLDAWVAWEHNFPLVSLKRALLVLQKEEQWHRIVQVIKWMLSKGQGTTMGTYEQLIRALEKDGRAEEAHQLWVKKISHDLHSVPWTFCELMISIYYRNNMLSRLVKLFKGLESYERRPPYKSIVQKVADAYEMLGILEEKNRVLEKYSDLFSDAPKERFKESRKGSRKNQNKAGKEKNKVKEANENFEVDSGPSNEEVV
ncbi:uncharacterized protein A4U43_C02F17210 [Asparagus officinalis]|uniref:Pentatricopeptide repeat-containing protein n=1 Tax=Asparagus officinalis TaxID=4686 RepID=A0A5P1FMW7_ASPOF|nr:uncharacterized protein A4U43_C02F17210 [Asparagus officinalis]